MIDGIKIVGGKGERRALDFYPTPPECTKALLKYLNLKPGTMVWEPAAGDGSMARVLTEHGCRVISTDIQTGTDFLTAALPDEKIEWIITNPPFNKSVEFIRHCAELERPFALLLKAQYWHSAKRKPLFDEIRPTAILPLTWRPDFSGQGASLLDMQWTVWEQNWLDITLYQPLSKPKEA